MSSEPVEILHPDGDLAPPESWFPDADSLPEDPFLVVAIVGPQASGKSTLVNAVFNTSFPVSDRSSIGESTTAGIFAQRVSDASRPTLVLDVEGGDARARGRDAKLFSAQCASFVSALADVIIVNLWFHDAYRLDSSAYLLIRSILNSSAQALSDGASARTSLIVTVRDVDDDSDDAVDSLHDLITDDVGNIWNDVSIERGLPGGEGATPLDEVVDLHVLMFPHFRYQESEFSEQVSLLRDGLYNEDLARSEHSKHIPADGLSTYSQTLWESVATTVAEARNASNTDGNRNNDDYYGGEDFEIVAGFRCDEAFSEKLAEASGEVADLLDKVEEGNRIDNLGHTADNIVGNALHDYDVMTTDYVEEPVYERKRKELEVILDTALNTVYMKNIAIIAREALVAFKTAIAEDIPAGYALHTASSKFVKQARESIRQGSSWSYDSEQADLQNMMREIATQQQKVVDTQVNASQQQSKAIQILRLQHAQMQAVQQQALGGAVGQWNLGAAYRPPDSNVNLSLAYQQGRTNLQLSMVPDESSSLLGPSGFTAGVGPGNLGMSFNVNF